MKTFQSATLINAALQEMWGQTAPSVKNTSDLISLGETILSSNDSKENFLGVVGDIVKRTAIRTLDLSVDMPYIFMDEESFFGVMRKINVQPLLAHDDNSWNIGADDYATTIWNINKPNVSETFFNNLTAFTIPVTIPDVMLKSAFTDGEMDEFITAIFTSIQTSLIMLLNAQSHLAVSNLIAERVKTNKQVNLLTLYNTELSKSLTAAQSIHDADFLRYASMTLSNYIRYLRNPSVLFNDGSQVRATARDNMHVLMLGDFASAVNSVLQSSTYHNELTKLPLYDEVAFWQSVNNGAPTFLANSSVNIIPASESDSSSPTAVAQSGIVCVMADRQAIGTTLVEDWTGADRNNRERYTNYTFGANRGYFNDLSENAVVFVIADTTAPNSTRSK